MIVAATILIAGAAATAAVLVRAARPTEPPEVIATTATTQRSMEAPGTSGLGPSFPAELRVRPVGDSAQSKLWFHDGRWWGVLLAEREFRIHSFDPSIGWKDSGVVVDPRPSAHVDVLAESGRVTTPSRCASTTTTKRPASIEASPVSLSD
jgi:hypothetical protein